jgi:putative heme-binding domain-containing protein
LESHDPTLIAAGLRGGKTLLVDTLNSSLSKLVTDDSLAPALRLESLRQIFGPRFSNPKHFDFLLSQLVSTNAASLRLSAADLIDARPGFMNDLSAAQARRVAEIVANDPLIAPSVAASLGKVKDLDESTRKILERMDNRSQNSVADQEKVLADFAPLLAGGDENRGQQIFLGKGSCSSCHRVGKTGGLVGPNLSKIGAIRAGRDLLESIAFPSATIAQGYETYEVEMPVTGLVTGVRVRQFDDSFVIRDLTGAEYRLLPQIAKNARRSAVSVMPEGLLNALSREEVRDLLAYLQKLK